jgi:hypothetical protein
MSNMDENTPATPELPSPSELSSAPVDDAAPARQGTPFAIPSRRATALMAVAMLTIGVIVGAAIGPAPQGSFADVSKLPALISALSGSQRSNAPTASAATTTPAPASSASSGSSASATPAPAATEATTTTPSSETPAATTPTSTTPAATSIAPVTKVWLINLSGSSFSEASAQPAAAPYITGHALAAGALLSSWSGVQGSAFASETALLASTPPQIVETVVEPPCPEGGNCAEGTPGALTTADQFLQQAVTTITATSAYRENGLIVVTFGAIAAGSASGLPNGSTAATLATEPATGVLLISPFVTAGSKPSAAYNPTSPKKTVEALLHK